jgi:hypothetical protein
MKTYKKAISVTTPCHENVGRYNPKIRCLIAAGFLHFTCAFLTG